MIIVVQPNPDLEYYAVSWKTHVYYTSMCRDWRETLSSCPAYWAGIHLWPCKHLKKMVARSKKLPVVVRMNLEQYIGAEPTKSQLAQILPTLKDRLVEFHFKSHAHESLTVPKLWASLPKGEAPLLKPFKLHLSNGGPCMPKIPTSALSFHRPILQHLALGGCQIDWDALKSTKGSCVGTQNFVTLHLHRIQPPPSRDILLSILRSSPKLESLRPERVIPHDFDTSHDTHKAPSSIYLRSLAVFTS
ncbi:hypothetical protein BDV98DRAFT_241485 [Pterulicium gracile]|uniref:F-box domain-containing protein n=1 Tax=Pterulicium gracile TaxID=1884261 RepID=A0A5C3QVE4_9AGAR|nr:hypothetical protein BDV98DRAFT_241485 [Pterula gracilis]